MDAPSAGLLFDEDSPVGFNPIELAFGLPKPELIPVRLPDEARPREENRLFLVVEDLLVPPPLPFAIPKCGPVAGFRPERAFKTCALLFGALTGLAGNNRRTPIGFGVPPDVGLPAASGPEALLLVAGNLDPEVHTPPGCLADPKLAVPADQFAPSPKFPDPAAEADLAAGPDPQVLAPPRAGCQDSWALKLS